MIKVPFYKMQGAGNDFIVIDAMPGLDLARFARKVCDRHMGVGADGVLILDTSSSCDHRMRIINADGSEAEMCGNGARCMAVYIARKFAVVPEFFTMETLAGVIRATASNEQACVCLSDPRDYRPGITFEAAGKQLEAHFINTGVPHAVIFVSDLREVDVNGLGRIVRNHAVFAPKGTNVNFVQRTAPGQVALRTYERGVEAETLACGTGSVASALVGYLQEKTPLTSVKGASMRVLTKSTEILDVTFDLAAESLTVTNVWLKGSGKFIAKGEYYY